MQLKTLQSFVFHLNPLERATRIELAFSACGRFGYATYLVGRDFS